MAPNLFKLEHCVHLFFPTIFHFQMLIPFRLGPSGTPQNKYSFIYPFSPFD
uniref:Uncharacterized protein n=1 Tax=Anguilla anguilla TaxID=7936 RepID=A0A0E9VB31_ANGAN